MTQNSFSTPGSLLGMTVNDPISGVSGIVTAEIMYLYGCQQVQVSPEAKEGERNKLPDAFWLDRTRVEVKTELGRVGPVYQNASGFNTLPPTRDPKGL